ncbi:hypothetical protein C440_06817 [Haloferax mucosum ATCC BAA-1512]|uniref:DUF309 domain-containing protein n=1 Tax=Haloferax mucosum ATCC BAA-1512 TaxID=662479 RepID=M0IDD0_9EURY|nr:DUF309 domain-containing protein [Haloferax mucosum]ELZ94766.1 hypothetical protein C440_06817 [Haloferax mucosum ATCC BAA-1512]
MDDSLRAGIAIYNAGAYRAAHGAWEATWLRLEDETDDERFLHGLIQFTAAVHHVRDDNDAGAVGLARSAREYLSGLDDDYRGVNLDAVRSYLAHLEAAAGENSTAADTGTTADAESDREADSNTNTDAGAATATDTNATAHADSNADTAATDAGENGHTPPKLRFDGRVVTYGDLEFEAIVVAAETLAEERDGYDESVVTDAIEYARAEVETGTQTQFTAMVFDFVQNETQRGLVFQRLTEHVRRKRRREDDVTGLFD